MLPLLNIISKMCRLAICGESSSLNLQIHRLLKCGSCRKITGHVGYRCVGARLRKVQFSMGRVLGAHSEFLVSSPVLLYTGYFTSNLSPSALYCRPGYCVWGTFS